MRIASAFAFESSLSNLQRRQQAMSETQQQLTSGKRVQKASDDPVDAARAERALAKLSRTESELRALDASRNAMQLTESALGDATELLQQMRELMVGAGNGSYSDAERKTVAESLRGLRNDLLAIANRSDGAGRYLFGGQGSATPPLRDAVGGVVYDGTAGGLQAAIGEFSDLTYDGNATWLQAPDPANPGTTLSIFNVIDSAVTDLLTPGRTSTQIAQTVSTGLAGIDASSENLSAWRSRAGEALSRADAIEGRIGQAKIDAESERTDAEDLDMLTAISDFKTRQSGYDAALQTYSMVQRMSLFDYIK